MAQAASADTDGWQTAIHEGDEMLGIFVETEPALVERNVARIFPVGDVDVVILQQRLHRAAQQRREMS